MLVPLVGVGAAAILGWWGFRWGALDSSGETDAVSPQLRLKSLCRLQSSLWALDRPHSCAILLELPGPASGAPDTQPTLPWPILPHELLGVELTSATQLKPEARRHALADAWGRRSAAILRRETGGDGTWSLSHLFGGKPQLRAVDDSTLEGQLVTLGSLAAEELSDEETWKVYMKTMVAKGSWWAWSRRREEPDDEDSRTIRLREACSLDMGI